jgi:hypothetical protein
MHKPLESDIGYTGYIKIAPKWSLYLRKRLVNFNIVVRHSTYQAAEVRKQIGRGHANEHGST